MAFFIWSLVSFCFILLAIFCFTTKTENPLGFWANAEVFKVNDVKAYHKALGKLWLVFGIALEVMGLPLLKGQNSPYAILTVLGVMFLTLGIIVAYVTVIEPKYRKK